MTLLHAHFDMKRKILESLVRQTRHALIQLRHDDFQCLDTHIENRNRFLNVMAELDHRIHALSGNTPQNDSSNYTALIRELITLDSQMISLIDQKTAASQNALRKVQIHKERIQNFKSNHEKKNTLAHRVI